MKFNNIKLVAIALLVSFSAFNCSDDDDNTVIEIPAGPDFSGTFAQEDQMGRPAISTVFVSSDNKDAFNVTIPTEQISFQPEFEARLQALNGGMYTTNALGLDAPTFTTVLATDVLTVSLVGPTTFFDPTTMPATVLTGRALGDDVITTELTLIFGGPMGTDNPGLTDDNVDSNDKAFLTSFPYLATPH